MDPQTLHHIAQACTEAMRLPLWFHLVLWSLLALVLAALLWHRLLGTDRR